MNDFGLYWWQPPKGWTNIGDEISPIVLGHVTGRHIVHASLDTCDGIAIGSVFLPRKAARRKRATPLFIWGSGTLQPLADGLHRSIGHHRRAAWASYPWADRQLPGCAVR